VESRNLFHFRGFLVMSMKVSLTIGAVWIAALAASAQAEAPAAAEKPLHQFLAGEKVSDVSLAYRWLDIAQEATAREVDLNGARPTIIARTLAIWATAM